MTSTERAYPWQGTASQSTTTAPSGAFHHVEARRQLRQPDTSYNYSTASATQVQSKSSATTDKPRIDWPQPVRQYVQRAFMPENAIPGIERGEMEKKLKQTITQANDTDTLHTIDWDALALPQQLIQNERSSIGVHVASLPWHQASNPQDSTTKKRKSTDNHDNLSRGEVHQVPWRANGSFEDRITMPAPASHFEAPFGKGNSKYQNGNLEKRQKRFDDKKNGPRATKHPWAAQIEPEPIDVDQRPIVGRCQTLEKKYFRLTAAPNPDDVRPPDVLRKTLDLLKKKWQKEGNYAYICDQFKSLRQDLTVQHVKNDFAVTAYELHARIALEKGDLGEYNQCQTQLGGLYSQNLGGHPMEFKAYRILYFIHTCNRTDMNDVLADLTTAEKEDHAVKHALEVRSALALGNYHRFFRLYLDPPNMGAYLMDMFIVRERLAALSNICKAYKPTVRIRFITEELGFDSDGECVEFLCQNNAQDLLEERDDGLFLLAGKAGLLFESAKAAAFQKVDIKGQI